MFRMIVSYLINDIEQGTASPTRGWFHALLRKLSITGNDIQHRHHYNVLLLSVLLTCTVLQSLD